MKILMVSSFLPYPLYSGGHIRLYNLIKELSMKHEITLVCEMRSHQKEEDKKEVEKLCKKVITVKRKKQWSIKNIIRTGFSLEPFLIVGHRHREMTDALTHELSREQFDVIHVETSYVMQNVPSIKIPIVLVEHNIEYMVYKRYADRAPFFLRPLLYIDVIKLKKKEISYWRQVDKLIAVSEEEKRIMKRKDVIVVSNGVDLTRFQFKEQKVKLYHSAAKQITLPEKTVLFIGDFKWIQNRDSVKWIITDIWPFLLRALESEMKLKMWIVGKNIPIWLKEMNMFDGIIFDENAPSDTAKIFEKADILLAPIRVGGGTSYKILEAMATGVPVITTTLGIEGFGAIADKHIIVADDTQSIVEKTARVLRDKEYYKQVRVQARRLIEERYDWKIIAEKLESVYKSVL